MAKEIKNPSADMRKYKNDISDFQVSKEKQTVPLETWAQKHFWTHTINDVSPKRHIR